MIADCSDEQSPYILLPEMIADCSDEQSPYMNGSCMPPMDPAEEEEDSIMSQITLPLLMPMGQEETAVGVALLRCYELNPHIGAPRLNTPAMGRLTGATKKKAWLDAIPRSLKAMDRDGKLNNELNLFLQEPALHMDPAMIGASCGMSMFMKANELIQRHVQAGAHFYVGITATPAKRLTQHFNNGVRGHTPDSFHVVWISATSEETAYWEIKLIAKAKGHNCLNVGPGGEGASPELFSYVYIWFSRAARPTPKRRRLQ